MKRIAAFIILFFFAFTQVVFAKNLFSDEASTGGTCSDSTTYSANDITHPFCTIQRCANVVQPGDICNIRGGTYGEQVSLTTSGTSGNYITFQPYGSEIVYLDGTSLGSALHMFHGTNVSYVKVLGLKIHDYDGAGIQFDQSGTSQSNSHIVIQNNEVYNGSDTTVGGDSWAIMITTSWGSGNSWTDLTIDNNNIHDVTTGTSSSSYNEALTIAGDINYFKITDNTVDNASYIGIDTIGGTSAYPHNGVVRGNTVSSTGYDTSTACIYLDGAQDVTVEDNTVTGCAGAAILPNSESSGVTTQDIIIRRNQVCDNALGIYAGGANDSGTTDHGRVVFNSCVATDNTASGSCYALGKASNKAHWKLYNNIVDWIGSSSTTVYIIGHVYGTGVDSQAMDYNLYSPASDTNMYWWYGDDSSGWYTTLGDFQTGTSQGAHSSTTSDPGFTNTTTCDLSMGSSSPAKDAGTPLTTTNGSGSGSTSLVVNDPYYFSDGRGISGETGDSIMVGSTTVTVTAVNLGTSTLTITPAATWSNGDPVTYAYSGTAPDIGAYEYSAGTTYNLKIYGIDGSNINKVNGVNQADINKVLGVPF